MSRTGIAGSESINFTKYCFSAFQDSCSHLHSHHRRWRFLLFMFCQTCGMIHAHNVSRMISLYVIFIFSIPEVEQWITLLLAKWSSRPWVDIPAQWNWLSSPTWPQCYWLLAYSLPSGSSLARLPPPSALWISTKSSSSLWWPRSSWDLESPSCCSGSACTSELSKVPIRWLHGTPALVNWLFYYCWERPHQLLTIKVDVCKKFFIFVFTNEHEPLLIRLVIFLGFFCKFLVQIFAILCWDIYIFITDL